jgi:hypothetical protein
MLAQFTCNKQVSCGRLRVCGKREEKAENGRPKFEKRIRFADSAHRSQARDDRLRYKRRAFNTEDRERRAQRAAVSGKEKQ